MVWRFGSQCQLRPFLRVIIWLFDRNSFGGCGGIEVSIRTDQRQNGPDRRGNAQSYDLSSELDIDGNCCRELDSVIRPEHVFFRKGHGRSNDLVGYFKGIVLAIIIKPKFSDGLVRVGFGDGWRIADLLRAKNAYA
jgi:hypothetical protein